VDSTIDETQGDAKNGELFDASLPRFSRAHQSINRELNKIVCNLRLHQSAKLGLCG
jgi:hypothetical protein